VMRYLLPILAVHPVRGNDYNVRRADGATLPTARRTETPRSIEGAGTGANPGPLAAPPSVSKTVPGTNAVALVSTTKTSDAVAGRQAWCAIPLFPLPAGRADFVDSRNRFRCFAGPQIPT